MNDQRPDHLGTAREHLMAFDSDSLPPAQQIAAAQAHAQIAIATALQKMANAGDWPVAP
jgi:hypothetical protein